MAKPDEPREEALKRFDERLDALAAQQVRKPMRFDAEGSGAGYRLVAELIGGVLGGLGLGWLVDRLAGTGPWGLIGGVLIGAGASVFVIARSAGRMSQGAERNAAAQTPPNVPSAAAASPLLSEEDEDGPGLI